MFPPPTPTPLLTLEIQQRLKYHLLISGVIQFPGPGLELLASTRCTGSWERYWLVYESALYKNDPACWSSVRFLKGPCLLPVPGSPFPMACPFLLLPLLSTQENAGCLFLLYFTRVCFQTAYHLTTSVSLETCFEIFGNHARQ